MIGEIKIPSVTALKTITILAPKPQEPTDFRVVRVEGVELKVSTFKLLCARF